MMREGSLIRMLIKWGEREREGGRERGGGGGREREGGEGRERGERET